MVQIGPFLFIQKMSQSPLETSNSLGNANLNLKEGNSHRLYVVLGFWGSKKSQILRYKEKLYDVIDNDAESSSVLIHIAPAYQLLFIPFGYLYEAYSLKRRIQMEIERIKKEKVKNESDGESKDIQIVIHVLSNNGSLLLLALDRILSKDDPIRKKIRGLILDSCPGALSVHLLRDAIIANRPPKWLSNILYYGPYALLSTILAYSYMKGGNSKFVKYFALFVSIFVGHEFITTFFEHIYIAAVAKCFDGVPLLFLYSLKDSLVSAEVVKKTIDQRIERKTGLVKSYRWEFSEHVAHLKDHPDEYQQQVSSFLF